MALIRCNGGSSGGNTGAVVVFEHRSNDNAMAVISDLVSGESNSSGLKTNQIATASTTNVSLQVRCGSVSGSTNSLQCAFACEIYDDTGTLVKSGAANTELIDTTFNPSASAGTNVYTLKKV